MEPTLLTFNIPNVKQPGKHRLNCYQWGDPKAERTVLCVHGLTRNGRDFDFLAQALARHYRVLCPDMPGRGKSQWLINPAHYSYPAYVADINFMLHKLHIKHVDWIGTSMGGIIAMMMASMRPGLIRSLILNDIGCVIPAAGLKRIVSYVGKTAFPTRAEAEARLRERCTPFGIPTEAHWQHLFTHGVEQNKDGTFRIAYDPAIANSFPKEQDIKDIDLWPLWKRLTAIPMLLIRGAQSDILTHGTAVEMKMRHPDLSLQEIPGVGHAPALMELSQITLISDWLRYRAQQKTHDKFRLWNLCMRFLKKIRKN